MTELDDRKLTILQAIIRTYLETGEPVGSRTISKYSDQKWSPATIRNDMADLEEMGLIMQPHTSAGRIPSDKGYRLYVDSMMNERVAEVSEMRDELMQKAGKLDALLKQVAKLLAVNTQYATMVTGPRYRSRKVKFIQMSSVNVGELLAVIVLECNIVKDKIIGTDKDIDADAMLKLNLLLNSFLQGLDLSEINLSVIAQMKAQSGDYKLLLNEILDAVAAAIAEEDDIDVYTSGATNMLKYPELGDSENVGELLYTLEEKKQLTELMSKESENRESRGIQVYIGDETPVESMKNCSVVTATYEISEGVYGKVGIIGPKRMDYEKVVATLQKLMSDLDYIFKDQKT
jgi:heat-inducible transcriptional repressor